MKIETLRPLSKMMWPSYRTIFKGVNIKPEGIHLKKTFKKVSLEKDNVRNYLKSLEWDSAKPPLAVLYLLAQRAQIALVLTKEFTIAIPGLMHIGNKLKQLEHIDYDNYFDIEVSMDVDYKEEGSLVPLCKVSFSQNGKIVALCESLYIAKRKSKNTSKRKVKSEQELPEMAFEEKWKVTPDLAKVYSKASDDRNPIHTSKLFAKIFGLKKTILHGWYSASRIVKRIEEEHQDTFNEINVEFKGPIFLPSTQHLMVSKLEKGQVHFLLKSDRNGRTAVTGTLKTQTHIDE